MAVPLSYAVRNVRVRWRLTVLAVVGITLVVAVFAVLMAMTEGFSAALCAELETKVNTVLAGNHALKSYYIPEEEFRSREAIERQNPQGRRTINQHQVEALARQNGLKP